jgi:hypothetical protein
VVGERNENGLGSEWPLLANPLSYKIKVTRDVARKNWSLHKNSLLLHTYPPTPLFALWKMLYWGRLGRWARDYPAWSEKIQKGGGGQLSDSGRGGEQETRRSKNDVYLPFFLPSSTLPSFSLPRTIFHNEHISPKSVLVSASLVTVGWRHF